jgi:hypothetical protein
VLSASPAATAFFLATLISNPQYTRCACTAYTAHGKATARTWLATRDVLVHRLARVDPGQALAEL